MFPAAPPLGWVVWGGGTSALAEPVAVRVTVLPRTGLPYWSRAVTVMVLAPVPLEAVITAGDATSVVCAAFTGPATANALKVRGDSTPGACASGTLSVAVSPVPRGPVGGGTPPPLELGG